MEIQTRPSIRAPNTHFFIDYSLYRCPVRERMALALLDVNGDYWAGATWHDPISRTRHYAGVTFSDRVMEGSAKWPHNVHVLKFNNVTAVLETVTLILNMGGIYSLREGYNYIETGMFHHADYIEDGVDLVMRPGEHAGADWWNKSTKEYQLKRDKWVRDFNHTVTGDFDLLTCTDLHSLSVRAAKLRHKKRMTAIARSQRLRKGHDRELETITV